MCSVKFIQGQNINVSGKSFILEWAQHTSGGEKASTKPVAKKRGLAFLLKKALLPKKQPQSKALLAANAAAILPASLKYQQENMRYFCLMS